METGKSISDDNSSDMISDHNSPEARAVEDQITELQKQIADGSLRSAIGKRDREKHQAILAQITALTRRLPPKPDVVLVRQETEY